MRTSFDRERFYNSAVESLCVYLIWKNHFSYDLDTRQPRTSFREVNCTTDVAKFASDIWNIIFNREFKVFVSLFTPKRLIINNPTKSGPSQLSNYKIKYSIQSNKKYCCHNSRTWFVDCLWVNANIHLSKGTLLTLTNHVMPFRTSSEPG